MVYLKRCGLQMPNGKTFVLAFTRRRIWRVGALTLSALPPRRVFLVGAMLLDMDGMLNPGQAGGGGWGQRKDVLQSSILMPFFR